MNVDLINRHVQAVAIRLNAYAAPVSAIAKLIAQSMGSEAPDLDALMLYLRKSSTQEVLAQEYEVGLWRGPGRMYRLVNLATPQTLDAIKARLNSYPDSTATQCAWCLIDEKHHAVNELEKTHDLHNKPIHRRLVHPLCAKSWQTMVAQNARNN